MYELLPKGIAMKGVMPEIPQHILHERARTGANIWDEMWEGVLHMPPMPNREHQDLTLSLAIWLRVYWAAPQGNRVHTQINLASPGGWPHDYRIPDLLLLKSDTFDIDRNEFFEGPPSVVVEIRSPGDETFDKMSFYAKLGVPEVWIIERDTKVPDVYALADGEYHRLPPGEDSWLESAVTDIRLRGEADGKLAIQLRDDQSTREILP